MLKSELDAIEEHVRAAYKRDMIKVRQSDRLADKIVVFVCAVIALTYFIHWILEIS